MADFNPKRPVELPKLLSHKVPLHLPIANGSQSLSCVGVDHRRYHVSYIA